MKSFVAGAAMFLCAGSAVASVPGGPYASLEAGAVFLDIDEIPDYFEVDTSFLMLGAAGYTFESGFRLEGEVSWRKIEAGPDIVLSENTYSFFANVLHEFTLDGFTGGLVRPYVGVGVGLAVVDADVETSLLSMTFHYQQTESCFAWQVIGGFAVPIASFIDLIADYRYTSTEGSNSFPVDSNRAAHNVTAGLRFHF